MKAYIFKYKTIEGNEIKDCHRIFLTSGKKRAIERVQEWIDYMKSSCTMFDFIPLALYENDNKTLIMEW